LPPRKDGGRCWGVSKNNPPAPPADLDKENGAPSSNEDGTPNYHDKYFKAPGNQQRLTGRLKEV